MGYKKTAIMLILSVLLCGCAERDGQNGEGGTASDNGVGQVIYGETSGYAYSETTVIDAENGGELVYRTGKGETIVGAAGSSDMLFLLTYREDVLDENDGSENDTAYEISDNAVTEGDSAEVMPFTLTAIDRSAAASESVSAGNGFLVAGAELDLMSAVIDAEALYENTELYMSGVNQLSKTTQEIDTFPDSVSGELLGYYQGKPYVIYYIYAEGEGIRQQYAYCYERQPDGSFAKSQDTLCMTIMDLYDQGYLFCGTGQDIFVGLNAYDRLLVWKQEEAKICAVAVDGSILSERQVDPEIINIKGTDGRMILAVGNPETSERNYFIYDMDGTAADGSDVKKGVYVWSDGTYLGLRDGYLYFYRYNKTAFNRNQYYFYRWDLCNAQAAEELLYETQEVVGQPQPREGNNGVAGFTVWKDACYFMDFDGESLWWFDCDLSDDAYSLTRLDVVDEYHGIFDAGEILYAGDSYYCGDCGELLYEYYLEGIQLYGDDDVTDRINETLMADMDESLKNLQEQMQTYQSGMTDEYHVCDDFTFRVTSETTVDGTTRYRFRKEGQDGELVCLEVDYSGYEYSGGAHGIPWRSHFLFRLEDGSEIGMADIIGISEDEFRTLAAEYTVADYLGKNHALYYFGTEEDELYETVYNYAGFDCGMYLGADGVVVEYSPYHLGSFGSGYIEVTIPYSELGLELLEIYGVNE